MPLLTELRWGPRSSGDRIVVLNRNPLHGEVVVPGAKNSVLKLMAATLLADGSHELTNVPEIADVAIMADLLEALGVHTELVSPATRRGEGATLRLVNRGALRPVAPYEQVERIRASINVLGPLLARCGWVRLAMPGGDDFGSRPIDLHLRGLEAMGASFRFHDGELEARADQLHGAHLTLDFPSVGATENLLTAAVYARGTTTIEHAAREPEIADLCHQLVGMGAHIEGIGTSTLVIHGVPVGSLRAVSHRTVVDRIQAATYAAAVAVSGGQVLLRGARPDHMAMLLRRFVDMGVQVFQHPDGVMVRADGRLRSIDVATLPYPGIATDYKPLLVTMLAVADGLGIVTENLYPGRFRYVEELVKLGANIRTDGHHAVVRGVPHLVGAAVRAPDIRAGAALVIAGLAATGATEISDIHHIDRGYDDLVGRLAALGASVERLSPTGEMPRLTVA